MRGLEIGNADAMQLAIHQDIARSDESRYDHRLHRLLLITGDHSSRKVAELLGKIDERCGAG